MATPSPVVSNPVTVTEAGAPSLTLAVDNASLPYTGGAINFTVTAANIPDGTAVELFKNGADAGISGTLSGGTCTIPYTEPANTAATPEQDVFTVQYTPSP